VKPCLYIAPVELRQTTHITCFGNCKPSLISSSSSTTLSCSIFGKEETRNSISSFLIFWHHSNHKPISCHSPKSRINPHPNPLSFPSSSKTNYETTSALRIIVIATATDSPPLTSTTSAFSSETSARLRSLHNCHHPPSTFHLSARLHYASPPTPNNLLLLPSANQKRRVSRHLWPMRSFPNKGKELVSRLGRWGGEHMRFLMRPG